MSREIVWCHNYKGSDVSRRAVWLLLDRLDGRKQKQSSLDEIPAKVAHSRYLWRVRNAKAVEYAPFLEHYGLSLEKKKGKRARYRRMAVQNPTERLNRVQMLGLKIACLRGSEINIVDICTQCNRWGSRYKHHYQIWAFVNVCKTTINIRMILLVEKAKYELSTRSCMWLWSANSVPCPRPSLQAAMRSASLLTLPCEIWALRYKKLAN